LALNWAMPFSICAKMGTKLSYDPPLNCSTKVLNCPSSVKLM
jgi:hypothetical protein